MDKITFKEYPQFFTATNLEWKHLLADDRMKDIIVDSLRFLVNDGRIRVYGFVIMPNHIHIIWQIQDAYERNKVQQSFLKFTAQKMKFRLIDTCNESLGSWLPVLGEKPIEYWSIEQTCVYAEA